MERIVTFTVRKKFPELMMPFLVSNGIEAVVVNDQKSLRKELRNQEIKLMLIDVEWDTNNWKDGIELIRTIRTVSSIPMIVISKQSADCAKIMALESGADDYVLYDCNPLEILARVKSQIRRYTQLVSCQMKNESIYRIGELEINDTERRVTVGERLVRLTPIEYKILRLLVQQNGKVFSNAQIYEQIWNMEAIGADNVIAVHIRHIREKIENNPKDPQYVKAVWGNGYMVG